MGGEVLASVRPIPRNQAKWWYWDADGINTSDRPVILAVAKDKAKTWAAARIKGQS